MCNLNSHTWRPLQEIIPHQMASPPDKCHPMELSGVHTSTHTHSQELWALSHASPTFPPNTSPVQGWEVPSDPWLVCTGLQDEERPT